MYTIVKTKFLCKSGSRTAPRAPLGSIKWEDRFIEVNGMMVSMKLGLYNFLN